MGSSRGSDGRQRSSALHQQRVGPPSNQQSKPPENKALKRTSLTWHSGFGSPLDAVFCRPTGTLPLALMVLALTAIACDPDPRDEALIVQPPLAVARVQMDMLYVQLVPGAKLDGAVALSIAPLRPGMTAVEAERQLGRPLATRTDDAGVYYRFAGVAPGVELAHLTGAGSNGKPWFKWAIVAHPGDGQPGRLLRPAVADLLTKAEPIEEIIIHDGQNRDVRAAFRARYKDGQLSDLEWYSIAGIPGG